MDQLPLAFCFTRLKACPLQDDVLAGCHSFRGDAFLAFPAFGGGPAFCNFDRPSCG